MTLFIVQGCGVTIICPLENVQGWVEEIIGRGGVPMVDEYKEAA